ncbi:Mobile element protein [methanotrophic endosymbiont of Bathymodiolus azoricus (Menez Gwen)]|jgi:transposase-like protein|nr:Mobile element protein [methanotrophic endosymbiont of Bathymodiolus azoricus (Menez Gwen)]
MISFKCAQFPKDVILYAVFYYVRYGVSYRDLEEIVVEREGLMLIMLRSIVGLSVMRQPLLQKLTLRNETQIDLGAWMKRISK